MYSNYFLAFFQKNNWNFKTPMIVYKQEKRCKKMSNKTKAICHKVLNTRGGDVYSIKTSLIDMPIFAKNLRIYYEKT